MVSDTMMSEDASHGEFPSISNKRRSDLCPSLARSHEFFQVVMYEMKSLLLQAPRHDSSLLKSL